MFLNLDQPVQPVAPLTHKLFNLAIYLEPVVCPLNRQTSS